MRIDRLIGIVILLLNRRKATAGELAEHFEVSERTIYRDIDALDRAGIPIVTTQGAGGGVGIMAGFALDRQLVTREDLSSIVTALKGLSSVFDDQGYVTAREKVESLIPQEQEQVVVDMTPWGMGDRYRKVLNTLKTAAQENRLLRFRYRSAKGEITVRTTEPIGLHYKGSAWYLYGFCRMREEYRYFKISRMSEVSLLPETFPPRPDAHAYPSHDGNYGIPGKPVTLRLLFDSSARARAEEFFGIEEL